MLPESFMSSSPVDVAVTGSTRRANGCPGLSKGSESGLPLVGVQDPDTPSMAPVQALDTDYPGGNSSPGGYTADTTAPMGEDTHTSPAPRGLGPSPSPPAGAGSGAHFSPPAQAHELPYIPDGRGRWVEHVDASGLRTLQIEGGQEDDLLVALEQEGRTRWLILPPGLQAPQHRYSRTRAAVALWRCLLGLPLPESIAVDLQVAGLSMDDDLVRKVLSEPVEEVGRSINEVMKRLHAVGRLHGSAARFLSLRRLLLRRYPLLVPPGSEEWRNLREGALAGMCRELLLPNLGVARC